MGYFGDAGNTSPNASPRVRYTDLELNSDLSLKNGDNKVGSETTIGLGMGMGAMGEPPVSAVFSGKVALSRRGSYAGLDAATIAATGNRTFLLAKAVNYDNPLESFWTQLFFRRDTSL